MAKKDLNNKDNKIKYNSDELLDILANYLLIYLYTYSKYENKNIELFIKQNFIYLNYYFSLKKNLQSQYIKLIVKNLNNSNDMDYYQNLTNYIISLHSDENIASKTPEIFEKTLNIYKKIMIKLIKKLSETSQITKLKYLFELIYKRLSRCIDKEKDYNFLKNILEVFSYTSITKYDEVLINNKIVNNNKITTFNEQYINIGQNYYTSIAILDNKNNCIKGNNQWCFVDIKELFQILLKLLKKDTLKLNIKKK